MLVLKLCVCVCVAVTALSVCLSVYYVVPASLNLGASTAAQSAGAAFGYEAASRVLGLLRSSKGSLPEFQMESVPQVSWAVANGLTAFGVSPLMPSVKQLTTLVSNVAAAILW
jgi:hypothetical protein